MLPETEWLSPPARIADDIRFAIERILADTGYHGRTQQQLDAANAEIERLAVIIGPEKAIAYVENVMRSVFG